MRKKTLPERQRLLKELFQLEDLSCLHSLEDLADRFVECAIGTFPLPFGLASDFVVNGEEFLVPMATEEPSVIAAATRSATLIKRAGGFTAQTEEPLTMAEIFFVNPRPGAAALIMSDKAKWQAYVDEKLLPNMAKRGGGFRAIEVTEKPFGLVVGLTLHVCESMGANSANHVAEGLKEPLRELIGGDPLLAIVSNASSKRVTSAQFSLPTRLLKTQRFSGEEVAERVVMAKAIADAHENRAVTHNKGIMNGVTAVVLATGNDTRAVEAACHHRANRKSLSNYWIEDNCLKGELSLPLSLGVVGGATSSWPPALLALKILRNPSSKKLCEIVCAVGLAQNLAALVALVTDGIQKGHMALHKRRTCKL